MSNHTTVRPETLGFLCHLPHIPSILGAIKTGSKEHMGPRHLKVILNKLGPQIKTRPRSQELSFRGPRQLHVPSGDAVPMSSPTDTSGSAKAERGLAAECSARLLDHICSAFVRNAHEPGSLLPKGRLHAEPGRLSQELYGLDGFWEIGCCCWLL